MLFLNERIKAHEYDIKKHIQMQLLFSAAGLRVHFRVQKQHTHADIMDHLADVDVCRVMVAVICNRSCAAANGVPPPTLGCHIY